MKKKKLLCIIIIIILLSVIILLLLFDRKIYEYFNIEDINNRCYGGSQDGATCELNIDNCKNREDCQGECEPICKGLDGKYLCFRNTNNGETVPIVESIDEVRSRLCPDENLNFCKMILKQKENGEEEEVYDSQYDELAEKEAEQYKCNVDISENRKCPGGLCNECNDKVNEFDGKCGSFNNGCGYPCINDTVLDRSSNGSTESIESWEKSNCFSHDSFKSCEDDGCIWEIVGEGGMCIEPEDGRPDFKIIEHPDGVPTQQGCCSSIKKCGIGEPGSETDPCFPNGYCVRCSYGPLSWNPELIISRDSSKSILNDECNGFETSGECGEGCVWDEIESECNVIIEEKYKFTIENSRLNDVLFLIPFELIVDEDDNETITIRNTEIEKFPPIDNDNKTSLSILKQPESLSTSGYIIQLIRLDKFTNGISDSNKPFVNEKSILNNDITEPPSNEYLNNVYLAGVKEYIIPNNMINNDINLLIGKIIKEQNINTRICSGNFGGITETNEPTENYQCICNNGFITNNNLNDWMPPIGQPVISLRDEPNREELDKLNLIFNPFYEIKEEATDPDINNIIIQQMRNINDWEERNKCRVINESVAQQGSTISRVSQDYEEIDELWNSGEWNPQQKAGGKHISDSDYIQPPSL